MYFKHIESDAGAKTLHDIAHKRIASERRAKNAKMRHLIQPKPEAAHNRKKAARLNARLADYDRMIRDVKFNASAGTFHKPGSLQ